MLLVVALYGCSDGAQDTSGDGLDNVPTAHLLPAAARPAQVRYESSSNPDFVGTVHAEGIASLAWPPSDAENYEIYRRETAASGRFDDGMSRSTGGILFLDDPCGNSLYDDQTGGLAATAVPAGYVYVGTVAGHAFVDDTIEEPGNYGYIVVGLDGAEGPSVVAEDLVVNVDRVVDPGTAEPPPAVDPDEALPASEVPDLGGATPDTVEPDVPAVTDSGSSDETPEVDQTEPESPFEVVVETPAPVEQPEATQVPVAETPDPVEIVDATPAPVEPVEQSEATQVPVAETPDPVEVVDATPAPVEPVEQPEATQVPVAETPDPVEVVDATPAPVEPVVEPVVESVVEPEPTPAPVPVAETPEPIEVVDAEPAPVEPPVEPEPTPAPVPVAETPGPSEIVDATPPPVDEPDPAPVAASPDPVESGDSVEPAPVEPVVAAPQTDTGQDVTQEVPVDCAPPTSEPSGESEAPAADTDADGSASPDAVDVSVPSTESPSGTSAMTPDRPLLAFPGAVGHGRNASGGRGGRVVIVNTRNDVVNANDGKVSLREALEVMSGPRIITFAVGGLFDTSSKIMLMKGESGSDVTVACQTAPVPGVIVKGRGVRIDKGARNVIMRHCTFRNIDPGNPESTSGRAIGIVGTKQPVFDMIFDHMSLSWATDENWTVWTGPSSVGNSARFTLSNSIVSEGDADSTHYESGLLPARWMHSMGPSCNSGSTSKRIDDCSIIGNYIAHNGRRNPLMWGVSGDVIDNVIYNWAETGLDSRPHKNGRMELYIVNNEYKAGPTSKKGNWPYTIVGNAPASNKVVRNNHVITWPELKKVDEPDRTTGKMSRAMSASNGLNWDCVGASRPQRDVVDDRVIHEYETSSGQVGIFANHTRDYSMYGESSAWGADHDGDSDGMADNWEVANGLNPNEGGDYRDDLDGDGYTNLEEYINEMARCG